MKFLVTNGRIKIVLDIVMIYYVFITNSKRSVSNRVLCVKGSSVSGDVTPVSLASELEFNSNEATAGSITDHDLMVRLR